MRIVLFSSSGPGNTNALIELQESYPNLIEIALCVSDRPNIPTLEIAKKRRIPSIVYDFQHEYILRSGTRNLTRELKVKIRESIHDDILKKIQQFEQNSNPIDLALLAYRRIIEGQLLDYFKDRMINQHPADLSILDPSSFMRKYTGIDGHSRSLKDGLGGALTSCILVNEGVDTGEILAQGKFVSFKDLPSKTKIHSHEKRQKRISDWPLLKFVVKSIAEGKYALGEKIHIDNCRGVYFNKKLQPYSGVTL